MADMGADTESNRRTGPHEDVHRSLPYLPALDGLRGLALFAVLLFHGGFSWISGGYLPLTAFFVLSGFLITSLLLVEWHRHERIDLGGFWSRRFRRLVPASLLAVLLVGVTVAIDGGVAPPGLRGDLVAAVTWTANWRFIFSGQEYADLFGDPSPFQHFWSLAVEEQFYLFMPIAVIVGLSARRGRRWPLIAGTASLVVASTMTMRFVHSPGDAPMRAYFGTDTRAAEILVGVLLATWMIENGRLRTFGRSLGRVIDVVAMVALVLLVSTWFLVDEFDDRLYEGGILVIAVLSAAVVVSATRHGSPVGTVLQWRPLVALGTISYGVYLFHWPIFLVVDEQTGLDGAPLFLLRMGITVPLAVLSYRIVERPIRAHELPRRIGVLSWMNATVAATACVVLLSSTLLVAPEVTLRQSLTPVALPTTTTSTTTVDLPSTTPAPTTTSAPTTTVGTAEPAPEPTPTSAPSASTTTTPRPVRVLVVGDSIAQNLATGLRSVELDGSIEVHDAAVPGCPILLTERIRLGQGTVIDFPPPCIEVLDGWIDHVDAFEPDIVVVQAGVGEVPDSTIPGEATFRAVGDPSYDLFVLAELQRRFDVLASSGATVVWTTAPCVDGTRHYAGMEPATLYQRLDRFNEIVRGDLATTRPIVIADLHRRLCPDGTFLADVEGVTAARPDGVHLSDVGAANLARRWLAPIVMKAAGR